MCSELANANATAAADVCRKASTSPVPVISVSLTGCVGHTDQHMLGTMKTVVNLSVNSLSLINPAD